MGAFNVVTAAARCPACSQQVTVRVQFKYGDTWQHEYRVGDSLTWGGNDVGVPGRGRVVVDGVAERCRQCGNDDEWNFYVFVERDVIVAVEPATGEYRFPPDDGFIVLNE